MLNVARELENYKYIDMEGQGVYREEEELAGLLDLFNKTLTRLGKEQFKNSQRLEDILAVLEEEQETKEYNHELHERLKKEQQDTEKLLAGLIQVMDGMEDIYRYTIKSQHKEWQEQLALQWNKTGQQLLLCDITRLEGEGQAFNPQFQAALQVYSHPELPQGEVLEVLRCGYIYKGRLIRKTEVIVNQIA